MKRTLQIMLLAIMAMMLLPVSSKAQESSVATLYMPYDTAIPEEMFVYVVTGVNEENVELAKLDSYVIPANVAVIVSTKELKHSGEAAISEFLHGTVAATMIAKEPGYDYYVLDETVGTWILQDSQEPFETGAFKAYLQFPEGLTLGRQELFMPDADAVEIPTLNNEGYYEIETADDLFWFAQYVNAGNKEIKAKLMNDIDLENRSWTPIGTYREAISFIDNPFKGIFDGQNHVIKNLNVHITDGTEAGLFSRAYYAELKNFGIINATIASDPVNDESYRAGIVAGEIHMSTITNVYSAGTLSITTEHYQTGGIAGECNNSGVVNCYTTYGMLSHTHESRATNSYYLADESNANSSGSYVTAAQMASGELAYKLGEAYGQTIGVDAIPVLGGSKVYYGYLTCVDAVKVYTNNSAASESPLHAYVDGVCSRCESIYQPQIDFTFTLEDYYGDGWDDGASIVVKKNGEPFQEITMTEYGSKTKTITQDYDPNSTYTFFWKQGGYYDSECSFEIFLEGESKFIGERQGAWVNNTVEPFLTLEAGNTEAIWCGNDYEFEKWGTLDEALAAAKNGTACFIQLQKDINRIVDVSGGAFGLDLNGKKIYVADYALKVNNGAKVTVMDSSAEGTGTIHNANDWHRALIVDYDANVTVRGGNFIGAGAVELHHGSTVTILGGSFSSTYHPTIENKGGTLTISGGNVQTDGDASVTSLSSAIRTTITGGTFAKGYYATVIYEAGVLDLSVYANITNISLYTQATVSLNDSQLLLPANYVFFNNNGKYEKETLNSWAKYTIGVKPTEFAVEFDANGGTGSMAPVVADGTYTLPECGFAAPEGLAFKAWMVEGEERWAGSTIELTDDIVISAVWITPYTVAFSANGGVGSITAIKTGGKITLPECPFLAPVGQQFRAWQIGENEYQPNQSAIITENTIVTALWEAQSYIGSQRIEVHMDNYIDGSSGLEALSYIIIKRDGMPIGEVRLSMETGYDTWELFEYDPNCEYTFHWRRGSSPESVNTHVEILLDGDLRFHAPGIEMEGEPEEIPFFTLAPSQVPSYIDHLDIIDGELPAYYVSREAEIGTLTYRRTLPNQEWNALYVPFEIPVTDELLNLYDIAYANNMHAYDNDDNGEIDELEMEVIKIKQGTLHANHPYYIRAKNEEAQELVMTYEDAAIYPTESTTMTCQSFYTTFTFTGIYSAMNADDFAAIDGTHYAIAVEGGWWQTEGLNPFRVYMTITERDGSPVKVSQAALTRVRIVTRGEMGEGTTGIEEIGEQKTADNEIYDLQGRKIDEITESGIYIIDGKKIFIKK